MEITCHECGKKFEIHPDLEPYKIDNCPYCTECYYSILDAEIEKHPIGFHPKTLPKTANELREKFEKDLQQLQERCKHKPSKWIENYYFPMHPSGYQIKYCTICEKELDRKGKCSECGCIITDKNVDKFKDIWLGYCKKCSPKVNKCMKQLENQFDEIEKKQKKKR
jgi:hypothetical protein